MNIPVVSSENHSSKHHYYPPRDRVPAVPTPHHHHQDSDQYRTPVSISAVNCNTHLHGLLFLGIWKAADENPFHHPFSLSFLASSFLLALKYDQVFILQNKPSSFPIVPTKHHLTPLFPSWPCFLTCVCCGNCPHLLASLSLLSPYYVTPSPPFHANHP